jgi:hypothetical protein
VGKSLIYFACDRFRNTKRAITSLLTSLGPIDTEYAGLPDKDRANNFGAQTPKLGQFRWPIMSLECTHDELSPNCKIELMLST